MSGTATPEVLIICGFEGVLNRQGSSDLWLPGEMGILSPVAVNTLVLESLRQLAARPGVKLIWVTPWGSRLNRVFTQLKVLPFGSVAGPDPDRPGFSGWKWRQLRRLIALHTGVPFVWIDAYAITEMLSVDPYALGPMPEHFLISPNPRHGVTLPELDLAEQFIETHTLLPL